MNAHLFNVQSILQKQKMIVKKFAIKKYAIKYAV